MNTLTLHVPKLTWFALTLAAFSGCSADSSAPNVSGGTGSLPPPGGAGQSTVPGAGNGQVPAAGTTGVSGAASGGAPSGTAGAAPVAGTVSVGGSTPVAGGAAGGSTPGGGEGAGGAPMVVQKLCAVKTTMLTPLIVDFEAYNGMTTADMFAFYFGGAMPGAFGTDAALGGFYAFAGLETAATMSIGAGHAGNYGLIFNVVQENVWGGGLGMWLQPSCVNATAFSGVSFWIRGLTPTNLFSVSLDMESTTLPAADPAGGGTCPGTTDTCKSPVKADIPLTMDWTQVSIPWADFAPGTSGTTMVTANGDNMTGLTFSFGVQFMPSAADPEVYVPVPGDISVSIDDVAFMP